MTLTEWINQLPKGWQDSDSDVCAICKDDEVWDYNVCITCAEEMNEGDWV